MSDSAYGSVEVICRDNDLALLRRSEVGPCGYHSSVLVLQPVSGHVARTSLDRITHEFELRDQLTGTWAVSPLALRREGDCPVLLLNDPGGVPLERQLEAPIDAGNFLELALKIATAVGEMHQHGLVHKNLKPTNVLVDCIDGNSRLTGFGIASRLPRERQAPKPAEVIAGTLAYMSPEQTGRMNRSVDARSDLYSLGVIFYRMLTGHLPFDAAEPMAWIHCHIARVPEPPISKLDRIPAVLSQIVVKLLAKRAEERYQTANGLKADLAECLAKWKEKERIDEFVLGMRDKPDRLLIPEKLYGREREIDALVSAFNRVVANGTVELVLISGYPGVGKSSLVHELHKVLVPSRGLFASGKFDQYNRDVPYSTVAQAFRGLIRQILSRSENEMAEWRHEIQEALGSNGAVLLPLIPELELIIGHQPPVHQLGAQEEKDRFLAVFIRLLGVFAQKQHPLALFLDDLQWLDTATLKLLEHLVCHAETSYVLLIGAYRDNEVDLSHPLTAIIESIRGTEASAIEVNLSPLTSNDIVQFIADALVCRVDEAAPLANLVHEKTAGNPFFTIQFMSELEERRLIGYDEKEAAWRWDLQRIMTERSTDNVVDLMIGKLARLPDGTQEALKQLACLGNRAALSTLTIVHGGSEADVRTKLWDAQRVGLVLCDDDVFAFGHDRIQEAAYSLIPESERPELHARIGRLLLSHMSPATLSENLFDVVNHLNYGIKLLSGRTERLQLAQLNLRAARKAKASTAYASACIYLNTGVTLLDGSAWKEHYPIAFGLSVERAECEHLCGNHQIAEQLVSDLLRCCKTKIDIAAAYKIRIDSRVIQARYSEAIECSLECLRLFDIKIPSQPTRAEVDVVYEEVCRNIGQRTVESLIDHPLMANEETQAAMRILATIYGPAYFIDFNLVCLSLLVMVNLSLRYGNADASTHAYVWFGVILGTVYDRYAYGYEFGKLACALIEKFDLSAHRARTYFPMEMLTLWARPVDAAIECIRIAHSAGVETGDVAISCYSCNHLVTDLLTRGTPLDEVWRESARGLAFARKARYQDVIDIIVSQQRFMETMQGKTFHLRTFNAPGFDEAEFEATLTPERMSTMVCWYWIIKLQARCICGDYEAALGAAAKAAELLWSSYGHIQVLDYHYYTALALAGVHDTALTEQKNLLSQRLAAHLLQLRLWAENCSATFSDKRALIEAECARLEGRVHDAMHFYEDAIRLAREHGFVQNQAIASELAARFYAMAGFPTITLAYARNARYCYDRWGATGKVRDIDEKYSKLSEEMGEYTAQQTIETSIEGLDLATVLKVSQAVSGEIVLEKLISILLRTAIEHVGAVRGVLILINGADMRVRAEATARDDSIAVDLFDDTLQPVELPDSVIRYASRTGDSVLLDDASASADFSGDEYIRRVQARSVLCLPLVKQGRSVALLYLENNLSPDVFTPRRVAVLKLLASEAATSLENSLLYSELQLREYKIRRLVEANIVGIFFWDFDGKILDANDAFLEIVGFDRSDLAAGLLNWKTLTPPEWLAIDTEKVIPELESTGIVHPFEKEYFRKDGARVPVTIAAATYEHGVRQGVGFVLDLTERKRAEAYAREMQHELAHANRVATMGQLTASIAHEVRQPLSAAISNANAAKNWLKGGNDAEVEKSLEAIIRNGTRANDVIRRVHDLVKKAPVLTDQVDINATIREVIDFTRREAAQQNIAIHAELTERLPLMRGDRVQLQQLLLNLVVNAIDALSEVALDERRLLIRTAGGSASGIQISVQDSGPGLSSESTSRIFSPFYTTKANGLGMGLSICRSIVDSHGGRLWADAATPRGVIFRVLFPFVEGTTSEK